MLIGFCLHDESQPRPNEEDMLRDAGCERIFSSPRGLITDDVIDYVRTGDTLVIADLVCLGATIKDAISTAEQLKKRGVLIRSLHEPIVPGTPVGNSFGDVCTILAEAYRNRSDANEKGSRPGHKGRPAALQPGEQARAEQLLQRASVLEVARILKVSPATIYRYFPRKGSSSRTSRENRPRQEAANKADHAPSSARKK